MIINLAFQMLNTNHFQANHTGVIAKPNRCIASAIAAIGLLAVAPGAMGQAVSLGTAENFTIISSQGVTNSGPTVITGNIALSPLPTITGFPPGVVTGAIHYNDALAAQAYADALTAYNTLASLPFFPANDMTGLDLGGMTLTPGVYHFDSSVGLTGSLTLNTLSDPNAVFVFQIGSTLTSAVGSSVVVTGAGAGSDPNVFWQVGSSATINSNAAFDGSIFANASVSLGTNASIVNGRAVALTGAVTLLSNNITPPSSVPEPSTWVGLASSLAGLVLIARFQARKLAIEKSR